MSLLRTPTLRGVAGRAVRGPSPALRVALPQLSATACAQVTRTSRSGSGLLHGPRSSSPPASRCAYLQNACRAALSDCVGAGWRARWWKDLHPARGGAPPPRLRRGVEGDHPNIAFGWGYAVVSLRTKKIKGLQENDFTWPRSSTASPRAPPGRSRAGRAEGRRIRHRGPDGRGAGIPGEHPTPGDRATTIPLPSLAHVGRSSLARVGAGLGECSAPGRADACRRAPGDTHGRHSHGCHDRPPSVRDSGHGGPSTTRTRRHGPPLA